MTKNERAIRDQLVPMVKKGQTLKTRSARRRHEATIENYLYWHVPGGWERRINVRIAAERLAGIES